MKQFYRVLLAFGSTLWMVVVYFLKEKITIMHIPYQIFDIFFIGLVIGISLYTLKSSKCLMNESVYDAQEISLADKDVLRIFLCYLFIGISVPADQWVLIVTYGLVFTFTYLSEGQYLNPAYLLLGYHSYRVKIKKGETVYVISDGPIIRNVQDANFDRFKKINDTTFIRYRED